MIESLEILKKNLKQVVIGKEEAIDLILVGLLSEGHILIEDVPGVGKTLMAKALAVSLDCDFRRLQCTPDLTPTDVTGFFIFDRRSNDFKFRPGPVLTNILLVDEVNRAVPRTQSSLLESMEEKQVTVDSQTFQLPRPFFLLATQNPVELEGTFPLPEAQLDRFLLKISLGYPSLKEEQEIISVHGKENPLFSLPMAASRDDVLRWQEQSRQVFVHDSVGHYIVALVRATREHSSVALGASPRASLALHRAARALALLRGRDYVIPDDVKYLARFVLGHRLILRREERLRGIDAGKVIEEVVSTLAVPVEESGK
ncbi:MAG: MoxR family ATPase [Peptococcaceae bacterium]|nr:MoxR family ATPase [Peptococcaceae bacterium]MDH7523767.1 MoxR family ATPase [Peptococcaceae bacterium]